MHRRLNSNLKQSRALITFHSLADTYMYDDSIATNNYSNVHQQHWYDEPPYESDPDDFLMAGMGGAAATIQVCKKGKYQQRNLLSSHRPQGGRVRYTTNGQGVISLRSAGDISISQQQPVRRGLIIQQPPNPPTVIALKR